MRDPTRRQRAQKGSCSRSGVEEAEHGGGGQGSVEMIGRQGREQRPGHSEDHGVDVDEEDPLDDLAPLQVAHPLQERADPGTGRPWCRRDARDGETGEGTGHVGAGVDAVDAGEADGAQEQSREGGADHGADLEDDLAEGIGRGQVEGLHEDRDRCQARRAHEPAERGRDRADEVDDEERRGRRQRVDGESATRQGQEPRGDDHEGPSIDGVPDRTAHEGADDERNELDHADRAHLERGVGEPVDLIGDGHHGELGPEGGDEGPREEPAEVPALAQRCEVDQDPSGHGPPA